MFKQQIIHTLHYLQIKLRQSTYIFLLPAFLIEIAPASATSLEQTQEGKKAELTKDVSESPALHELFLSAYAKPALDIWLFTSPLLLGVLAIREDTVNHNQKEIAHNRSLRHNSQYGDWAGRLYINAAYVGAFATAGYHADSLYFNNAKAMFWASAMSGLSAQVLKHVVRERRPPPDYDNPGHNHRDRKSFPSGHTTSAFTFASVVQQFHGWTWGTPAYALATFVGWSRMNDNKHYLHDVIFGATLGAAYGVGVSHLYKDKSSDKNQQSLLLIPTEGGAQLSYSFLF